MQASMPQLRRPRLPPTRTWLCWPEQTASTCDFEPFQPLTQAVSRKAFNLKEKGKDPGNLGWRETGIPILGSCPCSYPLHILPSTYVLPTLLLPKPKPKPHF